MDAADKITRARTRLLLSRPWWASLLLHLRVEEDPSIPTVATDGERLFYNPGFVNGMTMSETEAVLCHEVGHCALLHLTRRGRRDPGLWNIAADMAVNALLASDGITLPAGCVPPGDLSKTAEEHYDDLMKQAQPRAGWVDLLDPGAKAEAEEAAPGGTIERRWKQAVAQAAGLAPAAIARRVEEAAAPRVPWREVLADFITRYVRSDSRSWSRASRRLPGQVPGWRREPESTVAVVIDTSGSVDGPLLKAFTTEAQAILAQNGVAAYVLAADAAVGLSVEPGQPFPAALPGGGGTDFRPALAACEARDSVVAIIYLTDGCGAFPAGCSKPVIWAMSTQQKAPFGTTIHIGD